VQAFAWLDIGSALAEVELVSVSGHKIGGPKGIGALVLRGAAGTPRPLFHGGPQERERRAGTQNVAGAVAMAAAARAVVRDRELPSRRVGELARRLVEGIRAQVPAVHEAVPAADRIAAICNLEVEGVESEELLVVLDELGVCASAGSACASGAVEPSHVLLAMGRSVSRAKSHVRLSLGHATTSAEIDAALVAFPKAVERLRA
jgi:cysteine desulfurase